MKQVISVQYAAARAVVLKALTDPSFHADKIKALKPVSYQIIEHSRKGDVLTIRVRRAMRNEAPVPAMLKKLVPQISTIEHTDRWNARTGRGEVELSIEGLPVKMQCSIETIEHGSKTELRHTWDIQSSLPLIGGAAERFIAGDLPRLMEQEAAAGRPFLARFS